MYMPTNAAVPGGATLSPGQPLTPQQIAMLQRMQGQGGLNGGGQNASAPFGMAGLGTGGPSIGGMSTGQALAGLG